MNCIEVKDLRKNYQKIQAVKGIHFSVPCGEVFGFLGPNGAGKSTTIRMLTGQLRPSGGEARVMGFDVVKERELMQEKIGVVFENQNLYERLSARENLLFAARLYGVDKNRVDAVLEQVGLMDRNRDRVEKYSNGMKQRLLIARALLHEPAVLFLDEPTRGLDPHIAREIHALIKALAAEGMTVFLTTHYMAEAEHLCDRVAFIHAGALVVLDTPQAIKSKFGDTPQATLEDVFVKLTGKYLRE